jgi:signal transduction histidine kinase/CheY-like chemotaxis protein
MTVTRPVPPRLPRWAISVLAVLAAAGLGRLLAPWVGAESAYLLFTVAVMISARYGGLWSGLAATVFGGVLVLGVFVTAPGSPAQWLLLGVFLAVGACLSYLTESLAGRNADAQDRAADRQRLEAELTEAERRGRELQKDVEGLREAGHLKDAFLATVAHELRTPLSAMLGWAHVLREEKVDETTSVRALDAILRNARAQMRLITDLLDVSRIVAGTMRVEMQTVEPVSVIRPALETVRPVAEAKGVTLASTVDAEAGPVTGDPSRLQQVLLNLLTNAIKFTPAGGAVAVRVQALEGQMVVTVEDTGPGIPPAFLPHVFERFRQASGEVNRGKGGLGLGMAIARKVVELHEGTITAANRDPGPGAVFTVRLPIKALRPGEARPAQRLPAAPDPESIGGRVPSLEGLAVLLMDADEARETVVTILQKRGARVTALSSCEETLAVLAEQRPDVLLLDLELADADEDSLIQKIRALPAEQGGATPAAALAAFGAGDRTRALLSGFQLQLAKPVRPAELVAAVANLAGRTRPPAVAQAQEAQA